MMGIPDPRERAERTYLDGEIRDDTHNEDRVVVDIMIPEVGDDFEKEPADARQCAATVDAAEVLGFDN
jgi:hypothetical protein